MTRETRTGDANDYNDGNNDVDDDLTLDNDKGLPARQVRLFPLWQNDNHDCHCRNDVAEEVRRRC